MSIFLDRARFVFAFVLSASVAKDAKIAALQAELAEVKAAYANALADDAADEEMIATKTDEASQSAKLRDAAIEAQRTAEANLALAQSQLAAFSGGADELITQFAAAVGYVEPAPTSEEPTA